MTACCGTDVTVFGHTQADCPHTMLPALDIAAREEHVAYLAALSGSRQKAEVRADRFGHSVRWRYRRIVRSRT